MNVNHDRHTEGGAREREMAGWFLEQLWTFQDEPRAQIWCPLKLVLNEIRLNVQGNDALYFPIFLFR